MKVQWGGGILSRKNPKELQRFTKNKKQKTILIGSIIGIVLIIGGISLYRTFALYKEEQTFNVLEGTIPYFVYGDVKLAVEINGEKQTAIPSKEENYVVETKCDNGEIEWDYENWGPIIKNITKETRCSLNFVTNNAIGTLGKLLEIDNLDSIDTLITNMDTLIKSKEGMTYLAKSPNLVNELQNSSSYNDEIKKKILDSEVISEDLKYDAGLPCYLFKNNKVLKAAWDIGPFTVVSDETNAYHQTFHRNSRYNFSVNDKNTYLTLGTINKIKLQNYTKLSMNYMHFKIMQQLQ